MYLKEKFNIKSENLLEEISHKTKGTMGQNEYYKYEEKDKNGKIISRIAYWECTSLKPPCHTNSGYIKYDVNGNKIEEKYF